MVEQAPQYQQPPVPQKPAQERFRVLHQQFTDRLRNLPSTDSTAKQEATHSFIKSLVDDTTFMKPIYMLALTELEEKKIHPAVEHSIANKSISAEQGREIEQLLHEHALDEITWKEDAFGPNGQQFQDRFAARRQKLKGYENYFTFESAGIHNLAAILASNQIAEQTEQLLMFKFLPNAFSLDTNHTDEVINLSNALKIVPYLLNHPALGIFYTANDLEQMTEKVRETEREHLTKIDFSSYTLEIEKTSTRESAWDSYLSSKNKQRKQYDDALKLEASLMQSLELADIAVAVPNLWRIYDLDSRSGNYFIYSDPRRDISTMPAYLYISKIPEKKLVEMENTPQYHDIAAIIRIVQTVPAVLTKTTINDHEKSECIQAYAAENSLSINQASHELASYGLDKAVTAKVTNITKTLGLDAISIAIQNIHDHLNAYALTQLRSNSLEKQKYGLSLLKRVITPDLGDTYDTVRQLYKTTDQDIQKLIIDVSESRPKDIHLAAIIFGERNEPINPKVSAYIKEHVSAQILVNNIDKLETDPKIFESIAKSLGISSRRLRKTILFMRDTSNKDHPIKPDELHEYIKIANNPLIARYIRKLAARGYDFHPSDMKVLMQMFPLQGKLFSQIDMIRKFIPNYEYQIANIDEKTIANPLKKQGFPQRYNADFLTEEIARLHAQGKKPPRKFIRALLWATYDPLRNDTLDLNRMKYDLPFFPKVKIRTFEKALSQIGHALISNKILKSEGEFSPARSLIDIATIHPEKIPECIEAMSVPGLDALFSPGGPLFTVAKTALQSIFDSSNPVMRANVISESFNQPMPFWRQISLYTGLLLKKYLEKKGNISGYPVTHIDHTDLPTLIDYHQRGINSSTSETYLERLISDKGIIAELVSGKRTDVPFNAIAKEYREVVFSNVLKDSIETSQKPEAKIEADVRNRQRSEHPLVVEQGMYFHRSSIDYLRPILLHGLLCAEALGEKSNIDRFPFHVDFSRILSTSSGKAITAELTVSVGRGQGKTGTLGKNGQLFYLYDRHNTNWQQGIEYSGDGPTHALVLGGYPSTEICGIVLANENATKDLAIKGILENGVYIPIYDLEGKLLFTPKEYDNLRSEYNMQVPVPIWDTSLKVGEQKGSTKGGTFLIPTKDGPKAYYVKFFPPEQNDRMWNEQLADNIYRFLGVPVPQTQIVVTEGSFGHASEMRQEALQGSYEKGALIDMLLANWDIVKTERNIVEGYRIDNGGALLYRATGKRKPQLSGFVTEIMSMRGHYPKLRDTDIAYQSSLLREKFTNTAISELVDSVRLPSKTRDNLKQILIQRRDFILNYFTELEPPQETFSEKITNFTALLNPIQKDDFNDDAISQFVPEWKILTSAEGYQHNGKLLGDHIKTALIELHSSEEYQQLSDREKTIATLATFFHDISKPTGKKENTTERDYEHEIVSAQIAATYLQEWGLSAYDLQVITQVISFDGVVSDIARNKPGISLSPETLFDYLKKNSSTVNILRAVNKSDVIATVGNSGFSAISSAYNSFFDQVK